MTRFKDNLQQAADIEAAAEAIDRILKGPALWEDDQRRLWDTMRYLRRLKERCDDWNSSDPSGPGRAIAAAAVNDDPNHPAHPDHW